MTRRKNKDGSVVEYFQLAHNVRHSETGSPVAEIVHNFGRSDELNRDDLVRLCRSIARVWGLEIRDPLAAPAETSESQEATALPADVKLIRTLDLGVPFVTEWSPQVVVALAVTRDGLPVRSWVFPGNTSDVETIKKVREDLRGWKLGRALYVADSGANSAANREEPMRLSTLSHCSLEIYRGISPTFPP